MAGQFARIVARVCVTFLALVFCAAPNCSFAHAVLVDQYPQQDATLADAPTEVRLRFNEEVDPVSVRVLDSSGRAITDAAAVSTVDATVHVRMPVHLPAGSYVVSYRVISSDSHPVSDSFVFSVGARSSDVSPVQRTGQSLDAKLSLLEGATRALTYGALLLAAGGALFLLIVVPDEPALPRRDRRFLCGSCILAALAALATVGETGARLVDVPGNAWLSAAAWRDGWQTSLGFGTAITLAGLAAIVIALAITRPRARASALTAGALLSLGGLVVSGHAATAAPRWLMRPAVGLHVACAAYWVGALLPLSWRLVSEPTRQAALIVERFSRGAVIAVGLIVACGLVIAVVQVERLAALVDTAYGRLLLLKLALVAAMLLLATLNKWRFTPRLARGENDAAKALRRAIHGELVLAAGIVLATGFLGETSPPRALAQEEQAHAPAPVTPVMSSNGVRVDASAIDGSAGAGRTASIEIAPARPGANTIVVTIKDAAGIPVDALEVVVWLGSAALGIEPREYATMRRADGRYEIERALAPVAGRWDLRVEATVGEFEKASFGATVTLR